MSASPKIERSVVTPIVGAIEGILGEVESLLETTNLLRLWSDQLVNDLPEDRIWQLFECAAHKYGCPELGIYAGEKLEIQDLGTLGNQLQDSLTLFQCLNRYNNTVSRYSSHASFWLERHGDVYRFCRHGIDLISSGRDYVEQFTIQLMIRIVRLAAGSKWQPCRIRIQANSDECFRADPNFDCVEIQTASAVTSIQIPLILGAQTIPSPCESPLYHQINKLLVEHPDHYRMHIDHAAKSMGIGRRTLQRYLAHEGMDWRGLVEDFRFREAIHLMTETDIKLIDLAHCVGYTDQANFGRAFRKWTGMSPRTYREIRLQ